jgi:SAM-dependent methyltransferase
MTIAKHNIKKVTEKRWKEALEAEKLFATQSIPADNYMNQWWYEQFDNYSLLAGRTFEHVLEVGCGPHTNIRFILPIIQYRHLYLNDPLIQYYFSISRHNPASKSCMKWVNRLLRINQPTCQSEVLFTSGDHQVDLCASKLEELPYRDSLMDLIICINVLDHVQDYDQCMREIYRVLRLGGVLVLGQDLTNEEDYSNCPESFTDPAHPIKLDHHVLEETLNPSYQSQMNLILPREAGRNPAAHYSTYLGILTRIK